VPKTTKPPLIINGCSVVEYAVRDRKVKYSGHSYLYCNGKEVGPVPRLAIGRDYQEGVILFHCGRAWSVLGVAQFADVKEAKRSAEKIYPGLSSKWRKTGISKRQAKANFEKAWRGTECSFCGKRPYQIEQMVSKNDVRICNVCVDEIAAMLSEK
jgi:hypothetical protein